MRRRFYRPEQIPYLGQVPGVAPGRPPGYNRAPFLVELNPSGARGAPITALRRLEVTPAPPPPTPENAPQPPPVDLTKQWPWLFPPQDVYPIVRASAVTTLAVGATLSILSIGEIPRGYRGVVKKFGQASNDFTNMTWTFLVKGSPKDPILGIAFQFGQLFQPTDLPGAGVLLEPGDDFVVSVTNTGIAAITGIRARVDLYWWPVRGA